MITLSSSRHRAFTLVEIIIAVVISSIVLLSIFEAYSNILSLSRRLEIGRILQENSRNATELIAKDVREKGIDVGYYAAPNETNQYTGSGNTILAIRWAAGAPGVRYYLMHSGTTGPVICSPTDTDCYLARVVDVPGTDPIITRLTDERVRISGLRFFISGASSDSLLGGPTGGGVVHPSEAKTTMVFSMSVISPGASAELLEASKVTVQSTISEKLYKSY